jgi:hypothetical protein
MSPGSLTRIRDTEQLQAAATATVAGTSRFSGRRGGPARAGVGSVGRIVREAG